MAEKKMILAIDDDPVVLGALAAQLTKAYDLRISKSAADASILLERIHPDLVLLDLEMPYISGFEFLHTIKKNPKFMDIPVIIVSGHCEEEFVQHAERSGASGVVPKPVIKETLLQKINEAFSAPPKKILEL